MLKIVFTTENSHLDKKLSRIKAEICLLFETMSAKRSKFLVINK
jgi:hypothetical protein